MHSHSQPSLHPISLNCFPATPCRTTLWYDTQMLVATTAAQHSGSTAIQAYCTAAKQLHMYNGCGPGKQSTWTNLFSAAQQWYCLEVHLLYRSAMSNVYNGQACLPHACAGATGKRIGQLGQFYSKAVCCLLKPFFDLHAAICMGRCCSVAC